MKQLHISEGVTINHPLKTTYDRLAELAFQLPPRNEITPQIVQLAQQAERDARMLLQLLRWCHHQMENSCPHVLTEDARGRELETLLKGKLPW